MQNCQKRNSRDNYRTRSSFKNNKDLKGTWVIEQ